MLWCPSIKLPERLCFLSGFVVALSGAMLKEFIKK